MLYTVAVYCYRNSLYLDCFLTNCNLCYFMVIAHQQAVCRKVFVVAFTSISSHNLLPMGIDLSTELRDQNELSESAQEMLNLLEGPFRSFHRTESNSICRLSWESTLIARRFVLILIKTFVSDTLIRLYLMLFFSFCSLSIIFRFDHLLVTFLI